MGSDEKSRKSVGDKEAEKWQENLVKNGRISELLGISPEDVDREFEEGSVGLTRTLYSKTNLEAGYRILKFVIGLSDEEITRERVLRASVLGEALKGSAAIVMRHIPGSHYISPPVTAPLIAGAPIISQYPCQVSTAEIAEKKVQEAKKGKSEGYV